MQATTTRPKVTATADGEGVVSHAGSRLLADVADRTTLTGELAEALVGVRKPRARHDPGRVLVDMAVAVADGARRSPTSRCWPIRPRCSGRWRRTRRAGGCWTRLDDRAAGRGRRGAGARPGRCRGRSAPRLTGSRSRRRGRPARELPGLVIDLDASIVVLSQREGAGRADVLLLTELPEAVGRVAGHRAGSGGATFRGHDRRDRWRS